ncbi:Rab5-interacting family protein [Sneathiella marina]|uniref:Rab5-interacting family protein n=1 Tax=Sneathiella marina TaxID=2950108 RepID=A0ABY4WAK2_9PROT|nr:Rab5-interacting family protein [Sneathiella marina]USG63173.1 Rab5-interacting family protein [Sneathiella marina]
MESIIAEVLDQLGINLNYETIADRLEVDSRIQLQSSDVLSDGTVSSDVANNSFVQTILRTFVSRRFGDIAHDAVMRNFRTFIRRHMNENYHNVQNPIVSYEALPENEKQIIVERFVTATANSIVQQLNEALRQNDQNIISAIMRESGASQNQPQFQSYNEEHNRLLIVAMLSLILVTVAGITEVLSNRLHGSQDNFGADPMLSDILEWVDPFRAWTIPAGILGLTGFIFFFIASYAIEVLFRREFGSLIPRRFITNELSFSGYAAFTDGTPRMITSPLSFDSIRHILNPRGITNILNAMPSAFSLELLRILLSFIGDEAVSNRILSVVRFNPEANENNDKKRYTITLPLPPNIRDVERASQAVNRELAEEGQDRRRELAMESQALNRDMETVNETLATVQFMIDTADRSIQAWGNVQGKQDENDEEKEKAVPETKAEHRLGSNIDEAPMGRQLTPQEMADRRAFAQASMRAMENAFNPNYQRDKKSDKDTESDKGKKSDKDKEPDQGKKSDP